MAVVFDASVLIDLFNKKLSGDRRIRLDHLIATLSKQRTRVLVPTPALAEFLVKAGNARTAYLRALRSTAVIGVEPFDQRAAVECALLLDDAWTRGQQGKVTRTKFKFDWQIVAIAKSRNATAIYSDDPDIGRAAARVGIPVYSMDTLPLPSSAAQHHIEFEDPVDPAAD